MATTQATRKRIEAMLGDPETREDGLRLLAESPLRYAASMALVHLDDPDEFVRTAGLECLRERGGRLYGERAADCLHDKSDIVRVTAIECLVAWGRRNLSHRLVPLLDDRSPLVRAYAAWALGSFYARDAHDTLAERLRLERHPLARAGILESLVRLTRNDSYLELLIGLLSHDDHRVRCFTAGSLVGAATSKTAKRVQAALRDRLEHEETVAGREALQRNLAALASDYDTSPHRS